MLGLYDDLRHPLGRFFKDPAYRGVSLLAARLAWKRRRHPGTTRLLGQSFHYTDAASLVSAARDIIADGGYCFHAERPDPVIFDLGANIGIASAWFLKTYPRARIIAFEPDLAAYSCLALNVAHGGTLIRCHQAAAWTSDGTLRFASDGADGGQVADGGGLSVPARDIRPLVAAEPVIDLLKVDVEGSEYALIDHLRAELPRIRNLALECHDVDRRPRDFAHLVSLLGESGFQLVINGSPPRRPLLNPAQGRQLILSATRVSPPPR